MSSLLPSLQAERIRSAVVDYLSTTFALTDAESRSALADFLESPERGVFTGPFVRLRLPYQPSRATTTSDSPLDWVPPFPPYRHQEQAYQRLSTKRLTAERPRPQPTIITTGTGSGKTESFLHPILDHVLRARGQGITGIKALILYPMNALASDQAHRIAQLITTDPALAGVTAALYTGDTTGSADQRSRVTPQGLITDRYHIRHNPPDILLTNYKMLDQLLLRPEDQELWAASAHSLTYLVLDEFHTYDGAQGTDVAMLLRRLGLAIRAHLPADDPLQETYTTSPLGPLTPVATSATLGDDQDPTRILHFAHEVFGCQLDPSAVITETRTPLDQWAASHLQAAQAAGLQPRALHTLSPADLAALAALPETAPDPSSLLAGVVDCLHTPPDHQPHPAGPTGPTSTEAPSPTRPDGPPTSLLASALQAHPAIRDIIEAAQQVIALDDLALRLLTPAQREDPTMARMALSTLLAALSAIRAGLEGQPDRSAVSVEITLWIREITRIDRALSSLPEFRWGDDEATAYTTDQDAPARPALYCRACGRSGWGITLAPTGQSEKADHSTARHDRFQGSPRFRTLLHAPGEEATYLAAQAAGEEHPEASVPGLRWYSVADRELLARRPTHEEEAREGRILPVLTLTGTDAEIAEGSTRDRCPSCESTDVIRFLGSAVATLLSVSLTTLFGDERLDDAEKRALVFTDSVQDAAHRAGYVDQRSHTMSLRSALRSALTTRMPLEEWVDTAMAAAEDAFDRYRLVPAALTHHQGFQPYWDARATRAKKRSATTRVRRRLLFDTALEVGLQTTYGRTLEATGSIAVHVDAGGAQDLAAIAHQALAGHDGGLLPAFARLPQRDLLAWARGTLERMRRDGAIDHEWLTRYKKEDSARTWIWYKRKREQGQPAFPSGRTAPAFPQVGGRPNPRYSAAVPVASPQSWYATWTRKCLGISAHHAARLAPALLEALAQAGILTATATRSKGRVYAIPAGRVLAAPLGSNQPGPTHTDAGDPVPTATGGLLVCSTCHSQLPVAPAIVAQLDGAPCLSAPCHGRLEAQPHPRHSFYRDLYAAGRARRVDAHEHTSLLAPQEREHVETGFKRAAQRPGDPNVLVATPTLEMGIDIGDLSTVMLASLPETVASYIQRAGRAGRRNGSALTLAYVPGWSSQLPHLADPLHLLNGSVAPPSTYLGAEEILRRQFLASVIDHMARRQDPTVPGTGSRSHRASTALGSTAEGSFIAALLDLIERDGTALAAAFTATFPHSTPGLGRLAPWVRDREQGPGLMLHRAAAEHHREAEALHHQITQIEAALPDLKTTAEMPGASEEDTRAWRSAQAAHTAAIKRVKDLNEEYWISALERRGVLPNYALIDDSVLLAARVSWRDPDSDEVTTEPHDINRPSQRALAELAPGATFYAHGMEMGVDGIDDSDLSLSAQWWLCCEACGYVHTHPAQEAAPTPPPHCPRCLSTTIADIGRARRVMPLTRVFADVTKDDARIGDTSDERIRARFEVLPLADFDPGRIQRQWSAQGTGFGLVRYRGLALRWLNTGQATSGHSVERIGGRPQTGHGFRLCEACGKRDTDTGTSSPREHRPWCRYRNDPAEHVIQLGLMRELRTEAIALILPLAFDADHPATASLGAAVLLGLELVSGGAPAHLDITTAPHPTEGGDPGETRPALLLHDTIPGGTGYLTDLEAPSALWNLLVRAAQHLEACPCRHTSTHMCHHCLQPYAGTTGSGVSRAAALHALRQILGLSEQDTIADLNPGHPQWTVQNAPVAHGDGESPLEARFRVELIRRLEASASVRTVPDRSGAPALEIDGGRWRMRPQVDAAGSRPDFMLEPSSGAALAPTAGGTPMIAVFTDGWTYHASHEHNRLAEDADKRERLRSQGYRVVSLAAADLDGAWNPPWLADPAVTMLKNGAVGAAKAGSVTDQSVEVWRGGPMALLEDMILGLGTAGGSPHGHGTGALGALADSAWGPLMVGASLGALSYQPFRPGSFDALGQAAACLRPGLALPETADTGAGSSPGSMASGSLFIWPHLVLAVRLNGASTAQMALVLDDSAQAIEDPAHREAWLTWLRLGNLLPLADTPVTITTAGRAVEELEARARFLPVALADPAAGPRESAHVADEVEQAAARAPGRAHRPDPSASPTAAPRPGGTPAGSRAPAGHGAPPGARPAPGQESPAQAFHRLGWGAVDRELTDAGVLALLPHLAAQGVAHEADGQELEGGIMADLSWEGGRVVVLAEAGQDDAEALERAGWHVVIAGQDPAAAAEQVAALLGAGGDGTGGPTGPGPQ
ncbi:DEAD/DEAH box helicase [Actinomyces capricornis]|uniref:Helicase n=1 Tax=Actinomyces capricornis TaxID=2755559 RepID=A0ABM7U907_9ACTO|nr:DEAD/DEAH box helicase [Actinomyces capricornis]BDA63849.1 helicase [Actinomyces capricornis]